MNWVNILKKNDNVFKKEIPNKQEKEEEVIIFNDPNMKDYDDEFDIKHSYDIMNIKFEFKEFIEKMGLPFMDKNKSLFNTSYNFNDYMKYNSKNLIKIKNKVDKENEEYLKEIEEEEEDEFYDNYQKEI
jgi:hypothetical protein